MDFIIIAIVLLGIWLAVVIFATTRHEFWRDEVRAFSFSREAGSPWEIFLEKDGHPVLWYLLLYLGKSIVNTSLVLPITSILVAFVAVAVFVFFAPFPFWFKGLFLCTAFSLYEYSVMARNYGVSMLLLFVGAIAFRNRHKHPLILAFVLALLANTNVHSVIFTGLITALWIWETVVDQKTISFKRLRSLSLPLIIIVAGILVCIVVIMPGKNTIASHVYSIGPGDLANSLVKAVLHPEQTFSEVTPAAFFPLVSGLLLYLAALGLLYRPDLFLSAIGGQIALGIFFQVGYPGVYRHQGLFIIFLLFLYWVALESLKDEVTTKKKRLFLKVGLYGAVLPLVLWNVAVTNIKMSVDIQREMSSSKVFGAFLNESAAYQDAIIVPEPDYLIESLPYYANNAIYLTREHRFCTRVTWTDEADCCISLEQLVSTARDLKMRYNRPILIVLGHEEVGKSTSGEMKFSYNKVFSWNVAELQEMNRFTTLVAEFNTAITDENYRVYAVQ